MATISDIQTVKRNIQKMVDAGADESEIDQYVSSTPFSLEQIRSTKLPGSLKIPQAPRPELTPMAQVGRGMMDIYQGAKQKYLNWTDKEAAREYTDQVNAEIGEYEKGRGENAGFDWPRLAGNIATPLLALPGGGQTKMAQAGIGALTGGTTGYTLFNPNNTPQSNAINTGIGMASGAVTNVAAPYVIRGAAAAYQGVKNQLMLLLRKGTGQFSDDAITNALMKAGVPIEHMTRETREGMVEEARKQLQLGKLNPEEILRKSQIDEVIGPEQPMRAQITRNPADWTTQENLQKIEANVPSVKSGEKPTITTIKAGQSRAMAQYADDLADDISRSTKSTSYQVANDVINKVKEIDTGMEKTVGDLYKIYKDAGGQGIQLQDTNIAQALGNVIDDFGEENIAPAVLSRLKQFGFLGGKRTKMFTIEQADQLNRLINNNYRSFGNPKVYRILKDAINESLISADDFGGETTRKLLQVARKAASDRFSLQRSSKAITNILDDATPDNFFKKHVIGGDVRDLEALKKYLIGTKTGVQTWNKLRRHVLDEMKDAVTKQGDQPFTYARMKAFMLKFPEEKMSVLFSPDELARIEKLSGVARNLTMEVVGSAPNRSNTTPALIGQVLRMGNRIPFANVATEPMERAISGGNLRNAYASAIANEGNALAAQQAMQREALAKALMNKRLPLAMAPPMITGQYQ